MATKNKEKKKKHLPSAKRYFAWAKNLTSLSGEAPLERRFLLGQLLAAKRKIIQCAIRRCVTIVNHRLRSAGASMNVNMNARKKSAGKNKTDETFIPDKLYFRIGEVATLCRLPAYVLRFWESEFPQLKPVKSSTGQRMYRRRDVESVLHIKQLLYEQGFTIVGARQQLRSEAKTEKGQAAIPFPAQSVAEIQHIRQGLREILNLLSARRTG
jgi:DNA-binding transcriptional MerR regulator